MTTFYAFSTKTPRKLGEWRYIESIHKDCWYVDNGREVGPCFIEHTETSANLLSEHLNALEAKVALLAEANAALLYLADRVKDEHLEDVANKAIDRISPSLTP